MQGIPRLGGIPAEGDRSPRGSGIDLDKEDQALKLPQLITYIVPERNCDLEISLDKLVTSVENGQSERHELKKVDNMAQ